MVLIETLKKDKRVFHLSSIKKHQRLLDFENTDYYIYAK